LLAAGAIVTVNKVLTIRVGHGHAPMEILGKKKGKEEEQSIRKKKEGEERPGFRYAKRFVLSSRLKGE